MINKSYNAIGHLWKVGVYLNNNRIEMIGVNRIRDAILRSYILEPYIDDNDKTPSWDGNIFVYKSHDTIKKNIKGKVPVQIKGKMVDNFSNETLSYPFNTSDLQNYLKDGGAIFFVVQIIDVDKTKVYYKSLLPLDIKELLLDGRDTQNTISSVLKVIDVSNTKNLESICFDFLFHRELQYSTVNYSKSIEEFNFFDIAVFSGDSEPTKYMLDNEIYIYGREGENSIPIPINKISVQAISKQFQRKICINSRVYFNNYSSIESKRENFIIIGKNIKYNMDTGNLSYKSKGTLSERLQELRFLSDLVSNGYFFIGDIKIKNTNLKEREVYKIHDNLKYLNEVNNLMRFFNVKQDLEMDNLSQEHKFNINTLIDVVLYNRKVEFESIKTGISYINIGNINILILILVGKDGIANVYNYFSSIYKMYKCTYYTNKDRKKFVGSIYLMLRANDMIKASNMDLQIIEESIKSIMLDNDYAGYVTLLILELIKAYDIDIRFINCLHRAAGLNHWLEEYDDSNVVYKINRLQILKRFRVLEKTEKEELIRIRLELKDNFSMLCGISILLDNKSDFEYYFQKLSDVERELFIEYPIYKLAKED